MRRCAFLSEAACALVLLFTAACGPSGPTPSANAPSSNYATEPVPAEVYGVVTLAGATDSSGIQVFIPGGSAMAMTDAEGRFLLSGLRGGSYAFSAQHAGFRPAEIGRIEIQDSPQKQRFRLRDARLEQIAPSPAPASVALGSIRGRMHLTQSDGSAGEGKAIAGGRIELEGTGMRTITEDDGSFYLWNLKPGSYSLLATALGFEPHKVQLEVAAGDPAVVDVAFGTEPESSTSREITGRLAMSSEADAPTSDFDLAKISVRELPDLRVIVTSDGTFRIAPLAARTYTVAAEAEGYSPAEDSHIDLTDGSARDLLLRLKKKAPEPDKPAQVFGTARKTEQPPGRDMSGITVALTGTSFVAVTNAQGSYRFLNVPPGTYELLAQAEGFEPVMLADLEVAQGAEVHAPDLLLKPTKVYPEIVETNPQDRAADVVVAHQIPITLRFNKKVRPETVKQAIKIQPPLEYHVFAGRDRPDTDFDLALIVIAGESDRTPIHFETTYQLTVDTKITDYEGLRMLEPYTLRFRTGRASVIATSPSDGAKDAQVQPGVPVVIQFNARLQPTSVRANDVRIRPSLGVTPTIQMADNPKTGWTELQIQATWQSDTEYTITLGRSVRTFDGKLISNTPYTFKFRTQKLRQLEALGPIPR